MSNSKGDERVKNEITYGEPHENGCPAPINIKDSPGASAWLTALLLALFLMGQTFPKNAGIGSGRPFLSALHLFRDYDFSCLSEADTGRERQ